MFIFYSVPKGYQQEYGPIMPKLLMEKDEFFDVITMHIYAPYRGDHQGSQGAAIFVKK